VIRFVLLFCYNFWRRTGDVGAYVVSLLGRVGEGKKAVIEEMDYADRRSEAYKFWRGETDGIE